MTKQIAHYEKKERRVLRQRLLADDAWQPPSVLTGS